MSLDVLLDENGDPDLTDGKQFVSGVDELRQSLEMRLLSQVGWAVNDVEFGVEWLDFFGDLKNTNLAADKIANALGRDDRIESVMSVDIDPDYDKRIANIKVKLRLSDASLIADNGDPNLDFESQISI